MKTSEFETTFFTALTQHIAAHHQALTCTAPSSGIYRAYGRTVPSPDVVVTNPSSGAVLAIEVKGERYGQSLPYATLPQMKAMRDALQDTNGEVMLISAAAIPEAVLTRLQEEHISFAHAKTVEEALTQVESKLAALEKIEG